MEALEREAAILELSILLHETKLRAKSLEEEVLEMFAVVQAIGHADAMLDASSVRPDPVFLGDFEISFNPEACSPLQRVAVILDHAVSWGDTSF